MSENKVEIEFGAGTEPLSQGIEKVKGMLEGLTSPITSLTGQFTELGELAAGAFGIEKISEFSREMAELGASVAHATQMLGVSAEEFSTLSFAFGAMGQDAEGATMSMDRLERNMVEAAGGSGEAAAAFKALGVSVNDSNGEVKDLSDILPEIANRFAETANGPEKTAIAIALLGRSGAEMIPFLNEGAAGLDHMKQIAEETGAVLTDNMVEGMEHSAISVYTMDQAFKGIGLTIYEDFKPAIDVTEGGLIDLAESFNHALNSESALHDTMTAFVLIVDTAIGSIAVFSTGLQQTWQVIAGFAESSAVAFNTLDQVIQDVFSGHWAKAKADTAAGLDQIEQMVKERAVKFAQAGAEMHNTLEKLYSNVDFGGVHGADKGNGAKKEEKEKPHLPEMETADQGDSQMQKWKNELQQRLVAEQNYFGDSKREELQFWEEKKGLTEAGSKESYAVDAQIYALKKALAQQDLQDQLAAIKEKQDAAKNDYATVIGLEEQKLAILAKDYSQNSKQYQDALREKERMEREHQAEITRMNKETDDTLRAIRQADLQAQKDDLDVQVQLGEITTQEKIAQLKDLSEKQFQLTKQGLTQDAEQPGQSPQKIYDQIDVLTAKHTTDMAALNRQAALSAQKSWQDIVSPIENAFSTMITGIIQGTTTLHAAMGKVAQSITLEFIQARIKVELDWLGGQAAMAMGTQQWTNKSVLSWIFGEQAKTAATNTGEAQRTAATNSGNAARTASDATSQSTFLGRLGEMVAGWFGLETGKTTETVAGNATRTTAEGTAAAASIAAAKLEAAGEIPAYAAIGAAAAMASVAAIPFIGWAMAPGVGAEQFADSMGYLTVASASGGWDQVPFDGAMAELHKDEMVLPSSIATPLRSLTAAFPAFGLPEGMALPANSNSQQPASSAASAGGAGGGTTINNFNISATDAASFNNKLQQQTTVNSLSKALKKAHGQGAAA